MITPVLLILLGFQQSNAQLEQRTEQLSQQVSQVGREVAAIRSSLDQVQNFLRDDTRSVCSAEVKWQQVTAAANLDPQSPVKVSLISMVSLPREACLNAETRIPANYPASGGTFLCSGSVSLGQVDTVQNTYFEFRPVLLDYFAKWRDAATWEQSNFHRMICYDREGIEVRDPASQASTVKLFATVLPKRGGLATDEVQITIPPQTTPQQRLPVPRGF